MDILTLLGTIIRRWAIVVPIVAATFFAAFFVGTGTEPEYSMEGTALLVAEPGAPSAVGDPPSVAAVPTPVFAETLRSTAARERLAAVGAAVPYVVEVDAATSILRVTASSPDPAANVQTVAVVLDNLHAELALLEEAADIPAASRATVKQLSRPGDQLNAGVPSAIGSAFLVAGSPEASNPYPPSAYTTRVIAERMLGAQAQQRVVQQAGAGATFSVTQNQRDEAPLLYLSVLGTDASAVERVYAATKATVDDLLEERQAEVGVEEGSRTRLMLLNTPAGPSRTSGTLVKTVVTVVGLGLIAAAAAAIVAESLAVSRSTRRHHQQESENRSEAPLVPAERRAEVGAGTALSSPKRSSL